MSAETFPPDLTPSPTSAPETSVEELEALPVDAPEEAPIDTPSPERAVRPHVRYGRLHTPETGTVDEADGLRGIAARIKGYTTGDVVPVDVKKLSDPEKERERLDTQARERALLSHFLADHKGSELARLIAAADTAQFTWGKIKYTPDGRPVMVQERNKDGSPKFRSPNRGAGETVSMPVVRVEVVDLEPGDPPRDTPLPSVIIHPDVMRACETLSNRLAHENGLGKADKIKDLSLRHAAARRGEYHETTLIDAESTVWATLIGEGPGMARMRNIVSRDRELTYLIEQLAAQIVDNGAKGRIVVDEHAPVLGARPHEAESAETEPEAERRRRLGGLGVLGFISRDRR